MSYLCGLPKDFSLYLRLSWRKAISFKTKELNYWVILGLSVMFQSLLLIVKKNFRNTLLEIPFHLQSNSSFKEEIYLAIFFRNLWWKPNLNRKPYRHLILQLKVKIKNISCSTIYCLNPTIILNSFSPNILIGFTDCSNFLPYPNNFSLNQFH